MTKQYELALQIAGEAHCGQKDKNGADYILHPIYVSDMCESENAKIVALLHDVIEDTRVTLDDLRNEGFDEDVVLAVDCLTKRNGESNREYLSRVSKNEIATEVKFADIKHNIDRSSDNRKKYYEWKDKILKEMI